MYYYLQYFCLELLGFGFFKTKNRIRIMEKCSNLLQSRFCRINKRLSTSRDREYLYKFYKSLVVYMYTLIAQAMYHRRTILTEVQS